MKTMLEAAKAAKAEINRLTTKQKNAALNAMADALLAQEAEILVANALDLEAARGNVPEVMLDRLLLTSARIAGMAQGIREVAALPDPVGAVLEEYKRADGLLIQKTAVPMGVIAIIYESRPNVTSDAAALALKSGNVCVLRGGKEAFRSANAIVHALKSGLKSLGITSAFGHDADFSPILSEQEAWLDAVNHAARVKIDEEGVEAAAYTVMAMAGAAMPPEDEMDFILDRPFLFVITSRDDLPLFAGVVNNP